MQPACPPRPTPPTPCPPHSPHPAPRPSPPPLPQAVFAFVDVETRGSELRPGSYALVMQYPRRVFSEGQGGTLADANLVHKQEALFVEAQG